MKKQTIAIFGAACVLALAMAACAPQPGNPDKSAPDASSPSGASAQIPNPITEYATIEEAQAAAGFEVKLPAGMPKDYKVSGIAVIANPEDEKNSPVLEITYTNDDGGIVYRAAKDGGMHLSGDYSDYTQNETLAVGELQVQTRGDDGRVNVATWTQDGLDHALTGEGLSTEQVKAIIESMQ